MKWLETIELRTASHNKDQVMRLIKMLYNNLKQNNEKTSIKIYKQLKIETDFYIHIEHKNTPLLAVRMIRHQIQQPR